MLDHGMLKLPFPQYAYDLEQANKFIENVAKLPIRRVICYHGGTVTGSTEKMRTMLEAAVRRLEDPDKENALNAFSGMIARAVKAQSKFAAGTSQHSLQENRIHALRVAQTLLSQQPNDFIHADLERAKTPLASLISKKGADKAKGGWPAP